MFGIGTWELLVILVLALIVLGPTKLPDVARSLGRSLASLRKSAEDVKKEIGLDEVRREIEREVQVDELKQMVDFRGEIRRAVSELESPAIPVEDKPKDGTKDP